MSFRLVFLCFKTYTRRDRLDLTMFTFKDEAGTQTQMESTFVRMISLKFALPNSV